MRCGRGPFGPGGHGGGRPTMGLPGRAGLPRATRALPGSGRSRAEAASAATGRRYPVERPKNSSSAMATCFLSVAPYAERSTSRTVIASRTRTSIRCGPPSLTR